MKHVADRLVRYADENKIIHVDNIDDVALKRFARDKTVNHKIRMALYNIDPQLELLVPYQVDDPERQLKRYIQSKMGLEVNLSKLRKYHHKHYVKLLEYGSPVEVLTKWGLDYTYDRNTPPDHFKKLLGGLSESGVIRRLYTDHRKIYQAILHQARKEGKSVKEYVESLGFKFE